MKYKFMLLIAFIMAIMSSLLTAFGMSELFSAEGSLTLLLFVIIDLGRFLLFNFLVDEWYNLRKVKYFITLILCLLFLYSGVGIFSKLDSLVTSQTKEAMINIASYMKAEDNANLKQNRSEDLASIARKEYDETIEWNKLDYTNCIKRANKNAYQENNCNNTKRRLDKAASIALQDALSKADQNLEGTTDIIKQNAHNKSEISSILLTICKISQKECKSYDDLQLALSILIFLVIIGTDYLQIAIVLAVNTRKNKDLTKNKEKIGNTSKVEKKENTLAKEKEIPVQEVSIEESIIEVKKEVPEQVIIPEKKERVRSRIVQGTDYFTF